MPFYRRITRPNATASISMTIGKVYEINTTVYPGTNDPRYTFIDDTGKRYYQSIYDLTRDYIEVSEHRNNIINSIINT